MSVPQSVQEQLERLAETFRTERRQIVGLNAENFLSVRSNLKNLAMEKERQFERLCTTLTDISNGKQAI